MNIFSFTENQSIGEVRSVDTTKVFAQITSGEKLSMARVGRLVAIQGLNIDEWLIGIINKVWRESIDCIVDDTEESDDIPIQNNGILIMLTGTYRAVHGERENYFTRAILSLPDINRAVYPVEGNMLENFMGIISTISSDCASSLQIGTYVLDRKAKAFIDGNRLFQRHAALLGSTGSGKSWAVANIIEKASALPAPNIVLFDIHGEYSELSYAQQLKIAGPGDLNSTADNILFLPFWVLNFEEMQTLLVDYNEQNAPNQTMAILDAVIKLKKKTLTEERKAEVLSSFTIDSPIPFQLEDLIRDLNDKNTEEEDTGEVYASGARKGQPKTTQGPLYNKLTRLLIRLENKLNDRRYGFLLQPPDRYNRYNSLYDIARMIMGHSNTVGYTGQGVKVIDFSEVPSDILPIVVGTIARIIYQLQFWMDNSQKNENRHPIVLLCDEAHLYLPNPSKGITSTERKALENFERIAKEGRKYGVGLMIVTQRPSDVSSTVLSQCNNIIALRLTNEADKSVVRSLLPESISNIVDILSGLEVGESIIVGDSVLLPTRIMMDKPSERPKSATIDFWKRWSTETNEVDIEKAVENFRKQSRN